MGLLSGSDEVNIQVKMQGAREAAAEGKLVKESVEGIGTASSTAGTSSATASKKVSVLRKGFQLLGTAAKLAVVGGLAAVVGVLKVGYDEFSEMRKVAAQTSAVLKSTGGAAHVSAKHVDSLADSILQKTGIDDEAVKETENLILTFTKIQNLAGKGNKIFDRTTRTVQDMSVALGQSGKASAIQLGKALNDPIKGVSALRRVGVSLSESQEEQIKKWVESGHLLKAQKSILRELNKEFGGSAEAVGKTLPGKLNILKENFRNFAGDLFKKMVPALTKVVQWLSKLLHETSQGRGPIAALGNAVKSVVGFFKEHTTAAKALAAIIGTVMALVLTYRAAVFAVGIAQEIAAVATTVWTAAQWLLNVALDANPIGLVALAIVALIAVVVLVVKHFDWFKDKIGAVWSWLKGAVASVIGFVKDHWKLIIGIILGPVGIVAALLVTHWKEIKATVTGAVSAVLGFLKSHWRLIISILLGPVAIVVNQVIAHFTDLVGFVKSLPGKFLQAGKGIFNFIKTGFKDAINWVIDKWNNLHFSIPKVDLGPLGSIGGQTINFPDIPKLARGGTVLSAGLSLVGEAGPEILRLPRGARVEPLIAPRLGGGPDVSPVFGDMGGGGRPIVVQVPIHLDGRQIANGVAEVSEDDQARL